MPLRGSDGAAGSGEVAGAWACWGFPAQAPSTLESATESKMERVARRAGNAMQAHYDVELPSIARDLRRPGERGCSLPPLDLKLAYEPAYAEDCDARSRRRR